jgi:predicted kinase
MELIVFCGLQASGKSTFYKQSLVDTHLRLSMDMLKTRNREQILLDSIFRSKTPCVIDNTNPTAEDRKVYTDLARENKFFTVCYYFKSVVKECLERNNQREGKKRIRDVGIFSTMKKLELPSYSEEFDKIFYVTLEEDGSFTVEDWDDEV